jgi:hypothetical protein
LIDALSQMGFSNGTLAQRRSNTTEKKFWTTDRISLSPLFYDVHKPTVSRPYSDNSSLYRKHA